MSSMIFVPMSTLIAFLQPVQGLQGRHQNPNEMHEHAEQRSKKLEVERDGKPLLLPGWSVLPACS